MKSYNLFLFALLIGLLSSCKENEDLTAYDQQNTFIYFNESNNLGGTTNYVTSKDYSFAFYPLETQSIRVGIPVALIGMPLTTDKEYKVEVDTKGTTLPTSAFQVEPAIFHKGQVTDSLFVILKKTPEMTNKSFSLSLNLQDNANFKLGMSNTISMKLNISNQLLEPTWWKLYTDYLGPFYTEVYQQWILTYHRTADPTPDPSTGERYIWYWDHMPTNLTNLPNNQPILYYYTQVVKKYFDEHVIYPNGDRSQPRIILPTQL